MCAHSPQSCLTLWDPLDCSYPGSSVHGILEARTWSSWQVPTWDLPDPKIESVSPLSPTLQASFSPIELLGKPR